MARAVTVYSTSTITPNGLQKVMDHLKAVPHTVGWRLTRNDRSVFIKITTRDLAKLEDDEIRPVAELLKDWPKSSVVFMYNDSNPDDFEERMARAIAIAMAELWPIVMDDYIDDPEIIYPPGKRPADK